VVGAGQQRPHCAIGIYNQFVWVDPRKRTVIAKTAAFRRYAADLRAKSYRVGDCFALFRAIAEHKAIANESGGTKCRRDPFKECDYFRPSSSCDDAGRLRQQDLHRTMKSRLVRER